MELYRIKVTYNILSDGMISADICLHLPADRHRGTLLLEYQTGDEVLNDHLSGAWGYESKGLDAQSPFVHRRTAVSSRSRYDLEEKVCAAILSLKMVMHRVYLESTKLPDQIDIQVDPAIDPRADVESDVKNNPIVEQALANTPRLDVWREKLKAGDWVKVYVDSLQRAQCY